MSGWYDYYTDAAARAFRTLRNARKPRDVRLVVDPSNHVRKIRGDRDFGPDPLKPEVELAVRWLDWVVKGIDTGLSEEPPVRVFAMGVNEWWDEEDWPPPRTKEIHLYLSNADGRGALQAYAPGAESPVTYNYDPMIPCPRWEATIRRIRKRSLWRSFEAGRLISDPTRIEATYSCSRRWLSSRTRR